MTAIDGLLEEIERRMIIPALNVRSDQLAALLDKRDEETFSSRWMRAFRSVEDTMSKTAIDEDTKARLLKMRESSYLQAFEQWKSPDLAAYISDDFGLI